MNKIKYSIVTIITLSIISSCKINRYRNGLKVGKWVKEYTLDGISYKTVEFYKGGIERGRWKSFINKGLVFKEIYKNDTCYRTNYYSNGQILSYGKTTTDRINNSLHWFYIGDWKYFDEQGNLKMIKNYKKRLSGTN